MISGLHHLENLAVSMVSNVAPVSVLRPRKYVGQRFAVQTLSQQECRRRDTLKTPFYEKISSPKQFFL